MPTWIYYLHDNTTVPILREVNPGSGSSASPFTNTQDIQLAPNLRASCIVQTKVSLTINQWITCRALHSQHDDGLGVRDYWGRQGHQSTIVRKNLFSKECHLFWSVKW